ncbi:reverse transcriptase domain-containing protein [Tanacetum coccineum]
MANATPIVTTVTKPATKEKTPKDADATPRVNIQDFCEEHFEDILPVIMDKIRYDKLKEVHARLDFEESPKKRRIREGSQNSSVRTLSVRARSTGSVILTHQAQLNSDQTDQTPRIFPIIEAALAGGTLLTEIVLRAETAHVASKTAPAMGDTGSQGQKDISLQRRMTWRCPGYVNRGPRGSRAARVWFDELLPESIDGYKDLKVAFLAYFMQQKKYVKDPVEIYNIKQRDEETIEEFMERFKVETRHIKGAPECKRISGFMYEVNNPELTKRLNEHVPKTMEEMMITTAFIRGEVVAAGKKKDEVQSEDLIRKKDKRNMLPPEEKLGHIRMATVRHDRSTAINSGTSTRYPRRLPFKCFLDAYKGYHQIQMAESDEEKTAFHTSQRVYCYTKMPFGLKNAGATYQRLVDKAFDSQVGRNIEVYVDDLVIKSHTEAEMLRDIDETFRTLHKINMKLNPKKCTFGAVEGMFLGYMISLEGIKPCPNKTKVVLQLPSPRTIKEVQSLNGKLASLNRFLSKAISAVLMIKKDTVQTPVYFRLRRMITKMGRHAGRTQYHLPAKDVGEKTDPGRLPCREARRKSARHISYGSPAGAVLRFQFTASNNEAEYEALIVGLRIAAQMGVRNLQVSVDSKLVENQILGTYVAKEENMVKYLEKAKMLVSGFTYFSISQVPRSQNKKADALSKIALTSFTHISKQVLVEILKEKSIQEKEVEAIVEEEGPIWMTPIIEYLKDGTLLGDRKEASKLHIKARQYKLLEGEQAVIPKAVAKGIDIAGPFLEGPGNVKFLIVAMDYFTKWIEEKVVATITGNQAHRTMIKSSHGDTPFSLTYQMEAVIPAEIGMPTYRTAVVDAIHNDEELWLNLDLLEEKRECAAICEAKAKLKMTKYYNARVCGVTFRLGDFVYHSNDASHAVAGGKLGPK